MVMQFKILLSFNKNKIMLPQNIIVISENSEKRETCDRRMTVLCVVTRVDMYMGTYVSEEHMCPSSG
jgi:hypothetical protein